MKNKITSIKGFFALSMVICLLGCQDKPDIHIKTYVDTAMDSIQKNALNSRKINWDSIRPKVYEMVKEAKDPSETYQALEFVLNELEDQHSFLQKNSENLTYPKGKDKRSPSPYSKRFDIESGIHVVNEKKVARIFVPQGMRDSVFAQTLQNRISELSKENPIGWIIDLRGNGGGNMWPMLAGIGHLVGENPLGGSFNPVTGKDYYKYKDGKAIYIDLKREEHIPSTVKETEYQLDKNLPIAVLLDRSTASSGEALAVMFKGKDNTKFFGERTFGASTSTRGYLMKDSLNLVIAVSTFQDKKGKLYIDGVHPDIKIPIGSKILLPEEDPVISEALNWLVNF